jgi:phospholipid transport system substrate-binding protein
MILHRAARVGLALAFVALVGSILTGPVTDQLRPSIDRVMSTLADAALRGAGMAPARQAAVRAVLDEAIDFTEASRRALGIHWQARTEAERAEFVSLFKELVVNAYIQRLDAYAGETVRYAGESVEGDLATVRTRVQPKQGDEVSVDFRLHRKDGRWLVYDMSIAGVSLVANYRAQFNTIIQTSSYAELLVRIRARLGGLVSKRRVTSAAARGEARS